MWYVWICPINSILPLSAQLQNDEVWCGSLKLTTNTNKTWLYWPHVAMIVNTDSRFLNSQIFTWCCAASVIRCSYARFLSRNFEFEKSYSIQTAVHIWYIYIRTNEIYRISLIRTSGHQVPYFTQFCNQVVSGSHILYKVLSSDFQIYNLSKKLSRWNHYYEFIRMYWFLSEICCKYVLQLTNRA